MNIMTYLVTDLADLDLLMKGEISQLEQRRLIGICKKLLFNAFKASACQQLILLTAPKQPFCAFLFPTNISFLWKQRTQPLNVYSKMEFLSEIILMHPTFRLCFRTEHRIQKRTWRKWILMTVQPFQWNNNVLKLFTVTDSYTE